MKKPVLLVVWLCVLGGLAFAISRLGGASDNGGGARPAAAARAPSLDPKKMAAQWPQIVAHAAAPPRGNPQARYTLVEFGDFQCPQCGAIRPALEKLLAQNTNKANFIFVHRPFPFYTDGVVMHKWALPSAQASQAAASLGKFWPMYDALYSHQDDLEPGFYAEYAQQIGLPKAQFNAAYNSPANQAAVDNSMKFTTALGIDSTPTVLVHDNKTGQVWTYVGKDGTPAQAGVLNLIASPPWAAGPAAPATNTTAPAKAS